MDDIDICVMGFLGLLIYGIPLYLISFLNIIPNQIGYILLVPLITFFLMFVYPILWWGSDLYKEDG